MVIKEWISITPTGRIVLTNNTMYPPSGWSCCSGRIGVKMQWNKGRVE